MSTLNVSNITDGTTTVGTEYVVNGSAKAWVNFNGTGTIAARNSLNVSSLTDNATGSYDVNYSNNFNAADYSTPMSGSQDSSSVGNNDGTQPFELNVAYTKIATFGAAGSTSKTDFNIVNPAMIGDLA